MHIQFAYGRAQNAPAGTRLSLSAPPMRTARSCFHFGLMRANANAFERQGSPFALNLCIGAIRISYVCQCAITQSAVTRAVAQKECRVHVCGVARRKRNFLRCRFSMKT